MTSGPGAPSRSERPAWRREGLDWPNRSASRFATAAGLRWHVQDAGRGPVLLLLHGTGAATHSWRDLLPMLAADFRVIAPDLPGHAFSDSPPASHPSLPGMSRQVARLLQSLDVAPALVVGHSAGAAIAIRMALDGLIDPRGIVSLNGALLPFRGTAAHLFAPLAKLLAGCPAVPRLFAWRAGDRSAVERLIRETGSTIAPEGVALYARLLRKPAHVAGALGMMAGWDLNGLARDLPRLATPLLLLAGGNDRTVSPSDAYRVRSLQPRADVERLPGLGHLAHEEAPARVAALVRSFAQRVGACHAQADPAESPDVAAR